MGGHEAKLTGPDLEAGIPEGDLAGEAPLLGHARGEPVLLAAPQRRGAGDRRHLHALRRPARGGAVQRRHRSLPVAPRLLRSAHGRAGPRPGAEPDPLLRGRRRRRPDPVGARTGGPVTLRRSSSLRTIAIVGAGAAGESAAETLRREGYDGEILLFGADESPPVDRPNLSKDYLAGNAPEEWMPLRPPAFFGEQKIALTLGARVVEHRPGRPQADAGRRARGRLGRAAAGDRRRAGAAAAARRRSAARADAAHADATAARSSSARRAPAARSWWAPASSAWRWRRRCARAAWRSTSSRRRRCRSSARSAPSWAAVHARRARGARRPLPSRADGRRGRARRRHAVGRRRARDRRHGRARRRRQAVVRAGEAPPAWTSTAASSSTIACAPAPPASSRPATSRAIPTRRPASRCASSTGSSRSGWGASRRSTSWAAICRSRRRRSSGRRSTTSRCRTSATPRAGTASTSTATWPRATRRSPTAAAGRRWRSRRVGRDRTSLEAEVAIEAGDQATLAAFGRTR